MQVTLSVIAKRPLRKNPHWVGGQTLSMKMEIHTEFRREMGEIVPSR